jgi:hypothetical protein
MNMRKRYIFLVFSIILGIGIVYVGKVEPKESQIQTIEHDIEQIKIESNNTLEYAENVLDGVIEQKNKISDLGIKVKDNELTIEEQVKELKDLLEKANLYKKMANENANQAKLMEMKSNEQKQKAEIARKETEMKLNEALDVIEQMEIDYKKLNDKFIEKLQKIEMDTILPPTVIKESKKEKKNSKKKND